MDRKQAQKQRRLAEQAEKFCMSQLTKDKISKAQKVKHAERATENKCAQLIDFKGYADDPIEFDPVYFPPDVREDWTQRPLPVIRHRTDRTGKGRGNRSVIKDC